MNTTHKRLCDAADNIMDEIDRADKNIEAGPQRDFTTEELHDAMCFIHRLGFLERVDDGRVKAKRKA